MSGHKRATITISQEEYERLREAEVHLKALPAPKVEVIREIHYESQESLRNNLDWMTQRQEQFVDVLAGLGEQVREVEIAASETILDHQYRVQQALEQREGMMWDTVAQLLDESAVYFQSQILATHQQNQDALSAYDQRLQRMEESQEARGEIARQWLEAAESFCAFIQGNYNHAFFLPGQVTRMAQQLTLARENLEIGMPEAVLVSSQQAYMALSQMRLELEKLESEWHMLYCAVWEGACNLQALANENQTVEAVDLDGKALPVLLDVDFWTDGRLAVIHDHLSELFDRLEDQQRRPGTEELRMLLTDGEPRLLKVLEETVFEARVCALNSQMRINIADLVVQALQEQGFWLEEGSYDSDMRESYAARLRNYEGSQVEVQVAPFGGGLGENELHLRSFDEQTRTEHELLQRWREINRSLARKGLSVRQPEVVGAAHAVREARAPYRARVPQRGKNGHS